MQLINQHLPRFQFTEHHSLLVHGTPRVALETVERVLAEDDPWINRFIAVRELPARVLSPMGFARPLPKRPFGFADFTRLGRQGDEEVAYGLAGRFWQASYGLLPVKDATAFDQLTDAPKLVLNFCTASREQDLLLSTTTRVFCPDAASLRRFTPYWYLIRPFSGLIRGRLLRRIAAAAQAQA